MSRSSLLDRFDALLAADSGAPTTCCDAGPCTRSEIADRAHAAAGVFAAAIRGGEGTPVLFLAENGPDFLAGLLAAWRLQLVPVLLEPSSPPDAVRRIAHTTGTDTLLRLEEGWPQPARWTVQRIAEGRVIPQPDAAVVKVTSGSTGDPVGIAVAADALLADAEALAFSMGIDGTDRIVAAVPMSFSYGLGSLVVPALAQGGTLVLPRSGSPFDGPAAAARHRATVLPTVPVFVRLWAKRESGPWPDSLRLVLAAGSTLLPEVATAFRHRFGHPVHVFYGTSETGGITYDRIGDAAERGTVGTPVQGVQVGIEDGVVVVHSDAIGLRYVDHGAQAQPRIGLAGRSFRTSDLGRFEGGELRLLGRVSTSINVDGRKVSPKEIEDVLAAHQDVLDVVVTSGYLADRGIEVARAFVASHNKCLARTDLVAWCRTHLPPYKVPHSIRIVEEIPRNDRGKVDLDLLMQANLPPEVS